MGLMKTMPSENSGAQHLLLFDKTPHGAYKNIALENSGAQMYIRAFCFLIRHPVRGLQQLCFGEQWCAHVN